MGNLLQDLRYIIRMFRKTPGFTSIVVLLLAIGIGANGAIFSVLNATLLKPLSYGSPDRLVSISSNMTKMGFEQAASSVVEYQHLRDNSKSFEEVAAFSSPISLNLTGVDEPERIQAILVTANFFSVMGVQPALGRSFLPDYDKPGLTDGAIISNGLWKRRFGADPGIIDKRVTLNSTAYTILGVMPPSFQHPLLNASLGVEVWVPAGFVAPPFDPPGVDNRMLRLVGRLRPDVSIEQARSEMRTLAGQLATEYPSRYPPDSGWTVGLQSLHERTFGNTRPLLLILFAAVGFVLLIACTNVANLLLARGKARQKEMAIRISLGASRGRILRQLLTESIIISLLGGALGLLIAFWSVKFLATLKQLGIPRLADTAIDFRVIGFTLIISMVTAVLFGLFPALQFSKPDLQETLKEGGRGTTPSRRAGRATDILVVTEFALALVLLVGAGLLVRSLWRLQQVELGFNAKNLLTMEISLPVMDGSESSKYGTPEQRTGFYKRLLEKLGSLPGVESAGLITTLPMSAPPLVGEKSYPTITIHDRAVSGPGDVAHAEWHLVTPDYFRTMGIPLVSGRMISEQDDANAQPVLWINEAMARRYFPGQDPLGRRLRIGDETSGSPWFVIVGVVGNVKNQRLDAQTVEEMYVPYYLLGEPSMSLAVRTTGDPAKMTPAVVGAVRAIDSRQPVFNIRTMDDILASAMAVRQVSMVLLAIFAVIALLLAGLGIYGVITYSVAQRTHEIGIRMALGAQNWDVVRMILVKGLLLAAVGVSIGLAAASSVTHLMASLLYEVGAFDLATFGAAALFLICIGLVASYIPALQATKVDPMIALRAE